MNIFDEEKIDCHTHIFDPARFPFQPDTVYRPSMQEIGTAAQLAHVMDACGVRHALLVGPTSGYRTDNRCMLDALAQGGSRFKGIPPHADVCCGRPRPGCSALERAIARKIGESRPLDWKRLTEMVRRPCKHGAGRSLLPMTPSLGWM